MIHARMLKIHNLVQAREEIRKTGVDAAAIPWLSTKAVHMNMKLMGLSTYAVNVLKQEMLGEGGDAAVDRGVASFSVEKSDVLLMGTCSQYNRLVYKLKLQQGVFDELASEIQRVLDTVEKGRSEVFECGKYRFDIGEKTHIMGILNVTPDSFSDGGKYHHLEAALDRATRMVQEGASIIDIGGESTRPGHQPVDVLEEISRVVPVIEKLATSLDVPISIDTSKAVVAERALEAGATIVNDVWGLQKDKEMAEVVSRYGAGIVVMHNQAHMEYTDLMGDIIKFLRKSIEVAEEAGIGRSSIAIDPGIGFGKTLEQNLEVMRRLKELESLNLPILLGTSRKSLIGNILDLPVHERLEGTAATITLGIANGVDIIRVHDVKEMARVARMTDAMVRV